MSQECLLCDRIDAIKKGVNPYFVKELTTGYLVLGDYQFYRGYTLFISKEHAAELHELDTAIRDAFLGEMALVAEAVFLAFKPDKLNYELLGNSEKHLHWHLFPRRKTDPQPEAPVWIIDKTIRYAESTKPSSEELNHLKQLLLTALNDQEIKASTFS